MFPMIFAKGIEIGYAYTSFKWENNAKRNAGVTVAVIGLAERASGPKYIYTDDLQIAAQQHQWLPGRGADICDRSDDGSRWQQPARDGVRDHADGRWQSHPVTLTSATRCSTADPRASRS